MYYVAWFERENEPYRKVYNDEDFNTPSHRSAAEHLLASGEGHGTTIAVTRYGESRVKRFHITPATRASLREI